VDGLSKKGSFDERGLCPAEDSFSCRVVPQCLAGTRRARAVPPVVIDRATLRPLAVLAEGGLSTCRRPFSKRRRLGRRPPERLALWLRCSILTESALEYAEHSPRIAEPDSACVSHAGCCEERRRDVSRPEPDRALRQSPRVLAGGLLHRMMRQAIEFAPTSSAPCSAASTRALAPIPVPGFRQFLRPPRGRSRDTAWRSACGPPHA